MGQKQRLESTVKSIQSDLDKDRLLKKKHKGENRERHAYDSLPDYLPRMDYWCDHCQIDFVSPSYKVWSTLHEQGTWHSFCPICESMVYRYITAKTLDPYYMKSDKLRMMRSENLKDTLQPSEYGFKTMYGDAFEHYYKKHQVKHEELFNKYASMGISGKSVKQMAEEDIIKRDLMNT